MTSISTIKNALTGRFFMSGHLLIFIFFANTAYAYDYCVSTHFDEKALVNVVIDGDTLILDDKRHVRLIGIDTPEIFHDGRQAEPKAIAAKEHLQSLLANNKYIKLRYDAERTDKYGRTLAHLYMNNGQNIQAILLAKGLAVPLFIPPSISQADCYQMVSKIAKQQNTGLWSLQSYQPIHVSELKSKDRQYRVIHGKVERISESHSSIWINMEHNVALRIVKSDLEYFDIKQIRSLPGQYIEARGKLYFRNKQHRIRIRYPLDFTIIHKN